MRRRSHCARRDLRRRHGGGARPRDRDGGTHAPPRASLCCARWGSRPASWRSSIRWQALGIVVGAAVVGVPIGVAAGRILARSFLADLGVVATVVTPVLLVVLVIAGALVIGAVAAALPARRARPQIRLTVLQRRVSPRDPGRRGLAARGGAPPPAAPRGVRCTGSSCASRRRSARRGCRAPARGPCASGGFQALSTSAWAHQAWSVVVEVDRLRRLRFERGCLGLFRLFPLARPQSGHPPMIARRGYGPVHAGRCRHRRHLHRRRGGRRHGGQGAVHARRSRSGRPRRDQRARSRPPRVARPRHDRRHQRPARGQRPLPWRLVTTEGLRDVIEIGRQDRPSLYDTAVVRPAPLVPRAWRLEVGGRLDRDGQELERLDPTRRPADARRRRRGGGVPPARRPRSRPRAGGGRPRSATQGHDVSCSHEVSPEVREYERTVTTVVNAALRPRCRAYLRGIADVADEVHVMTSAGGLLPVADAAELPAALLLSGPAGGVRAAAAVAVANGFPDAITFDMGGTSTDVCLVLDGAPAPAARAFGRRVHRAVPGARHPHHRRRRRVDRPARSRRRAARRAAAAPAPIPGPPATAAAAPSRR